MKHWTERRKNRKRGARNLSTLHVEIEAAHHAELKAMALAAGMCQGEAIDALIRREIRRRERLMLQATEKVG